MYLFYIYHILWNINKKWIRFIFFCPQHDQISRIPWRDRISKHLLDHLDHSSVWCGHAVDFIVMLDLHIGPPPSGWKTTVLPHGWKLKESTWNLEMEMYVSMHISMARPNPKGSDNERVECIPFSSEWRQTTVTVYGSLRCGVWFCQTPHLSRVGCTRIANCLPKWVVEILKGIKMVRWALATTFLTNAQM